MSGRRKQAEPPPEVEAAPAPSPITMTIDRLFTGLSGYQDSGKGPNGRAVSDFRSTIYGELIPDGVTQLRMAAAIGPGDVFVDLGSGVGKVVLQLAIEIPGLRCLGVELDSGRHDQAVTARARAIDEGLISPDAVELRHDNILTTDLTGITKIFANSTCFSDWMLTRLVARVLRLPGPVTFATFRLLPPGRSRKLERLADAPCATSWNPRIDLHIYRSKPPALR